MEKLVEYFTNFASHVQYALIVNYDCPLTRSLTSPKKTFSFSIKDSHADIFAYNIKAVEHGVEYSIDGKKFSLALLGKFNVANALAAISACMMLGIDKFDAAKALEGFTGVKVRLEKVGSAKGITFYADFAHNPTKIAASAAAIKEHPGRLIMMYQPHTPFSVMNTGAEVAAELSKVISAEDIVLMQEIYELTPKDSVSSNDIITKIKAAGHQNAFFMPRREETRKFILANAKPGDRVVIMGAHDNSLPDFSRQLCKEI